MYRIVESTRNAVYTLGCQKKEKKKEKKEKKNPQLFLVAVGPCEFYEDWTPWVTDNIG